jgi:hypothetical protein
LEGVLVVVLDRSDVGKTVETWADVIVTSDCDEGAVVPVEKEVFEEVVGVVIWSVEVPDSGLNMNASVDLLLAVTRLDDPVESNVFVRSWLEMLYARLAFTDAAKDEEAWVVGELLGRLVKRELAGWTVKDRSRAEDNVVELLWEVSKGAELELKFCCPATDCDMTALSDSTHRIWALIPILTEWMKYFVPRKTRGTASHISLPHQWDHCSSHTIYSEESGAEKIRNFGDELARFLHSTESRTKQHLTHLHISTSCQQALIRA